MRPKFAPRPDSEISLMAEIAVKAGQDALAAAGKTAADVDAVICAAANMQRAYPPWAVEIQTALGINGWAFDMNVACSSATFGWRWRTTPFARVHAVRCWWSTPNYVGPPGLEDRDCHFIFGDVHPPSWWSGWTRPRLGHSRSWARLQTSFSNAIRNNAGFMSRAEDRDPTTATNSSARRVRRVFKEVCPMAAEHIASHLAAHELVPTQMRRFWLHQANLSMNPVRGAQAARARRQCRRGPIILDEFANTASAGSIIAFHRNKADFKSGELGIICSFGAATPSAAPSCAAPETSHQDRARFRRIPPTRAVPTGTVLALDGFALETGQLVKAQRLLVGNGHPYGDVGATFVDQAPRAASHSAKTCTLAAVAGGHIDKPDLSRPWAGLGIA